MPSFSDFSLQPATRTVLATMGITEPTAIQSEAIPALLAGRDLVGQSATGSGKTLAYGIPLIERLTRDRRVVQALVLVPTRELAVQVNTVLSKFAVSRRLTTALLVGGRPYGSQLSALRYGAQIVVGTPGRVQDHIERGTLQLHQLRICVLDEADQMLDSGFAPAIEEILTNTPDTRQMALFSATMPDWVVTLQKKFLKDPVTVNITAAMGEQSTIEQIAYQVPHDQKMAALCTLLQSSEGESSLIFGKTKFGVEKLGKQLTKLGFAVGTLHGDKSQRAREDVLTAFRRGQVHTLLATNVAARGLDIEGIYQVINYELPESSELFTHRIGRTGRMGRQGKAITLLVPSDVPKWRRMARTLGQAVALQKLTIDEKAMTAAAAPLTNLEAVEVPTYAQVEEQRPLRGRRQFSDDRERGRYPQAGGDRERNRYSQSGSDRERGRYAQPRNDRPLSSPVKRQPRERAIEVIPEWQAEEFFSPAHPEQDDRHGIGKQSPFRRASGRSKTSAFVTREPQNRNRRKPVSATPARRTPSSNRFASR